MKFMFFLSKKGDIWELMMRAKCIITTVFCLLLKPLAAGHLGAMDEAAAREHNHFWISQSVFIPPPIGVGEIHDVLCQDINGDGVLDRLYAHPEGLIAEFGDDSPSGWSEPTPLVLPALSGFPTSLFPSEKFTRTPPGEKTPWSMDGELDLDLLPAFWCRWTGPDRVIGFRLEGTKVIVTREVQLSPSQLVDVTPGGLVYGPSEDGKIYLDEYGVRRVLSANVPPLDWMKWSDVDGDREHDLIVKKRGGGLGVMRISKGKMHALEWLDQTTLLDHWFSFREENGRLSIFGQMAGMKTDVKWVLGDDSKWSIEPSAHSGWFDDLTMVRAEEVGNGLTYMIASSRHWRTTVGAIWRHGECLARFELENSDVLGDPRFSDMNGDGILDFVFWDERAEQLVCHYLLKNPIEPNRGHSQAELVFLEKPDSILVERVRQKFLEQLPQDEQSAVREALNNDEDIETIQLQPGALMACGAGLCQILEPSISLETGAIVNQGECSGHFKLAVPSAFPKPDGQQRRDCLIPGEWNHIVYTRDDNYESKLYLNNELAFEGTERAMDFDYRILSLGSEAGHLSQRFLNGDIDEVEVVHEELGPLDVAHRFEHPTVMSHPKSIATFDFDQHPNRRYPFGTDNLKIYEEWELVEGIHGTALRLKGEASRAAVFMKIPSNNFSISLWVRPRVEGNKLTRPGTILSLYGMRNLDLEVQPLDRSGFFSRPNLHMSNSNVEKPEKGMAFSSQGDLYCLSNSGRLFQQAGFDWRELALGGASDGLSIQGMPWFVDGALHTIMGRNSTHVVLDLETMEWVPQGRLNPLVGNIEHTIRANRGVLIIARKSMVDERRAFWWPNGSDRLHPVQMPFSAETIVAVMSALGKFVWVHDSGRESPVQLDQGAVLLPVYANNLPSWAWFASGALLLLVGAGTWRVRSGQVVSNDEIDINQTHPADEGDFIRMSLPVHIDVLQLLRSEESKQFDVQGLDDAFLIGDIETDETKRSRRARMIKDLNAWWNERAGQDLIQRDVDDTDKRRRIYKLAPGFGKWYDENAPFNDWDSRES